MDPAYVVALAVLPDQRIVLTHYANSVWSRLTSVAATTSGPNLR